ncbi:MAG: hypothetical protein MZW92_58735 [Comamonadaceae bacterium]|nr:hypothetical protein [Comamonadaceae bacterium]
METLFVSYVSGAFVPGITFYLGLVGKAIAYAFISPLEMPLMLITTLILLAAIIQFSQAIIAPAPTR